MLRYLKVDTKIIPNDTPVEDMRELGVNAKLRDAVDVLGRAQNWRD